MKGSEKINKVLAEVGLRPAAFARAIGLKAAQNVYDIQKDQADISKDVAQKIIAVYPNFRIEWLLTGEGEMLKTDKPYLVNHDRHGTPYFDVDFVNGFDLMCNDQTTNPTYYIDFQQYNNADCWVNATGDSMKPLINHGDIVAVKRLDDWPTYLLYGEIYAIVTDKFRTIKKVRKSTRGDGHLRLVPLNIDEFDEQDIPRDTIRVVFQVLGCAKKIF